MNLYGFGDGDPVNLSDPFGLQPCCHLVLHGQMAVASAQAALDYSDEFWGRGMQGTINSIGAANDLATGQLAGKALAGALGGAASSARRGGSLFRFGRAAESVEKLAADAGKSEAVTGRHGISALSRVPARPDVVRAGRAAVEAHFRVEQTGGNPAHHTIFLPKPVTQETADLINRLFRRIP